MKIVFNLKKGKAKMGFGEKEGWTDCSVCKEEILVCSYCGEEFSDEQIMYHENKGCHFCEDCVEVLKRISNGQGI